MRPSKHVFCWSLSRLIAALSDQFILFAIPLLIYRKTESISLAGAAYIIEWIPRLISPLVSGALVDSFCSRKVAVVSDGIRCALCLIAYSLFVFIPSAPFWIFASIAGAIGLFYETSYLAFDVSLTRTSKTEDLPKVQSLIQSAEQLAFILGPGLAVAIASIASLQFLFLFASALFFIAAYLTSHTDQVGSVKDVNSLSSAVASLREGCRKIISQPLLRKLSLVCFLQNVAVGLCLSMSPGYLQEHFGMKESAFGILSMLAGCASLVMFLTLPRILKFSGMWALCATAVITSPLALALMGLSNHYIPYYIGFASLVVVDGCLSIILRTTRATIVPSQNLAAVVSAMIFFLNVAFPLGGALVGVFTPVLGGQALLLSVAGAWALALGFLLRGMKEEFK